MDDFAQQTEEIGARLDRFIRKSRLKNITVAKTLGVAPSIITGMKQGGNYYGNRLVELCQAFPQLNPMWLLTGEGTMLNHGNHPQLSAHSERLRAITEAIADNSLHAGIILGSSMKSIIGFDLSREGVILRKNGKKRLRRCRLF